MRVVEFRIPLPLCLDEYSVAQLYNVAKKSLEDQISAVSDKSPDCVQYLQNNPFLNDQGITGQYSEKKLTLLGKFPKWITNVVSNEYFTLIEDSWNCFPAFKTVYRSNVVKNFRVEVHTDHISGHHVPHEHKVNSVDPMLEASKEIINLDIVTDSTPHSGWNLREVRSVRRRWHGFDDDWLKSNSYDRMIACKVFIVDLPMLPSLFQGRVEEFIVNAFKCELVNFHRRIVATVDEWSGFKLPNIRFLEAKCAGWLENLIGLQKCVCDLSMKITDLDCPAGRSLSEYQGAVASLQNEGHRQILDDFISLAISMNPLPSTATTDRTIEISEPASPLEWLTMALNILTYGKWQRSELRRKVHDVECKTGDTLDGEIKEDRQASDSSPTILNRFRSDGALIWKLTNHWMSSTWSKRVLIIDGTKLKYFSGPTRTANESAKSFDLEGVDIRYTSNRDELHGRQSGIILSHRTWLASVTLSADTDLETKDMAIQLQLYCSQFHLSNPFQLKKKKKNGDIIREVKDGPLSYPLLIKMQSEQSALVAMKVLIQVFQSSLRRQDRMETQFDVTSLLQSPLIPASFTSTTSCGDRVFIGNWKSIPLLNDRIEYRTDVIIPMLDRWYRSEPILFLVIKIVTILMILRHLSWLMNFTLTSILILGFSFYFELEFNVQMNDETKSSNGSKICFFHPRGTTALLFLVLKGTIMPQSLMDDDGDEEQIPTKCVGRSSLGDDSVTFEQAIDQTSNRLKSIADRRPGFTLPDFIRRCTDLKSRGLCGSGYGSVSYFLSKPEGEPTMLFDEFRLSTDSWLGLVRSKNYKQYQDIVHVAFISRKGINSPWQILTAAISSDPPMRMGLARWRPINEILMITSLDALTEK